MAACRQIWHLFVDDGWVALAVLVWLAVVWLLLPYLGAAAGWRPEILFFGLVSVLVAGAAGQARHGNRS